MERGIILSIMLIVIFIILGLITSSISFILLAPVIFTPTTIVPDIIKIMNIQKGDKVIDIGSGDGRVLFEIQKSFNLKKENIQLYGYDISPILVLICKIKQILRFKKSINFDVLNIFTLDLSEYNKIYCYLDAKSIKIIENKIQKLMEKDIDIEFYSYRFPLTHIKTDKEYKLNNGEMLYYYNILRK